MNGLALLEKIIEDLGFYIYPRDDGSFSFGDSLRKIEVLVSNSGLSLISAESKINSRIAKKLPLVVNDIDPIKVFLSELKDTINEERLGVTREIKARISQHRYRQTMINLWGGCAVTGIKNDDLIIASHAKPYSMCTAFEADDKYNGLPLLVHLDKLFDQGYIAFDNGGILISSRLDKEVVDLWNLRSLALRKIVGEVETYLGWHRENIFKQ